MVEALLGVLLLAAPAARAWDTAAPLPHGADDDDDGWPDDVDCEPLDPTIYPGAPEVCDGVDQDCDGEPDDGLDCGDDGGGCLGGSALVLVALPLGFRRRR